MDEGKSIGVNMIWALTILIIVAIIGGVFFYSGGLSNVQPQEKKIDVKVDLPDGK